MKLISWGFIGCGEVTEKKSGPAFNEVSGSHIEAVMSRSRERAQSYAQRHDIKKWYTDAQELINDPDVNAIYVATPPVVMQHLPLWQCVLVNRSMWRSRLLLIMRIVQESIV